MTKDNQMMPERIWGHHDGFLPEFHAIEPTTDDGETFEYIRADTIAAKDKALDVALEALNMAASFKTNDIVKGKMKEAIAQIEAVKKEMKNV